MYVSIIMETLYFAKISQPKLGLCNQIMNLISSIIVARNEKKKIVVVENFSIDSYKEDLCLLSSVLDLEKLNNFLYNKYNIKIYDRDLMNITLHSVYYGIPYREKNVTKEVLDIFCIEENIINIETEDFLNPIIGDPFIGVTKRLSFKYTISHKSDVEIFTTNIEEFAGYLKEPITLDFNIVKNSEYIYNSFKSTELDEAGKKMFDNILNNILFTENFYNVPNILLKDIDTNEKVNVIHLRLEEEASERWCNDDNKSQYIEKLEKKYIGLIEKHFDKSEQTIVLSYSTSNSVIDFLTNNDYKFIINEKQYELGSNVNAVFDFLCGTICNNVFIGNYNLEKNTGSLFSYFLSKRINKPITKVLIDLEDLDNEASVFTP